jgi:hypothetical protein
MNEHRSLVTDELAVARNFAETWADLLLSLPDCYECTLTCAEANSAVEFLTVFGFSGFANALAGAHASYDEPGDEHYNGKAADDADHS